MPFQKPVIHVMTENLVTIAPSQNLSDARALLADHDIHHLPVVDEGQLVGIVSATDLVKLSLQFDPENDDDSLNAFLDHQYAIKDIMRGNPISIGVEGTVHDAAKMLATGGFHALPVVGYDGALKGIVTSTDLIRLLVD